ncbi:MAG: hypothetical protein L0Z49_02755 [Actinobacteria bacterium]|nr:hypothetical protein [Actinomycetota bacterium]MCI0679127.1 hypothetical protein [Actinomycetota bacterium]
MMNLGDVAEATVPKLTLVVPPRAGGTVSTRTFVPHRCHQAIGVLGASSVATACLVDGSPGAGVADIDSGSDLVRIEHPTGSFDTRVRMTEDPQPTVLGAGVIRTARKLMDGVVYPRSY